MNLNKKVYLQLRLAGRQRDEGTNKEEPFFHSSAVFNLTKITFDSEICKSGFPDYFLVKLVGKLARIVVLSPESFIVLCTF